jgi:outer membrane immunogenic protein
MAAIATTTAIGALLAPPVYADEGWTGFYAGLHLGTSDLSAGNTSESDPTYGVHVGYDYDFGQFVLGGELAYDGSVDYVIGGTVTTSTTSRLKLKGGYDLGRTLVYGVVGHANLDGQNTRNDGYTVGLGVSFKATDKIVTGAEYLHDTLGWANNTDAKMDRFTMRASYKF